MATRSCAGRQGSSGAIGGSAGARHDAVLWLAGSAYEVIFDTASDAIGALAAVATGVSETSSWPTPATVS